MIRVLKENNKIIISGHSGYADFGKDIVCSAVSSIMITTVNAIDRINGKAIKYTRNKNDDSSIIEIVEQDEIVSKLLDNMLDMFKSLEKDYPKNINVKER